MNTRMQFLEHELAINERSQQQKAAAQEAAAQTPAADSEKIIRLEHKVRELEAMVNGITEELLDLKTITRKLTSVIERLGSTGSVPAAPQRAAVRRPIPETSGENAQSPAPGRAAIQTQLSTRTSREASAAPAQAQSVPQQAAPAPVPVQQQNARESPLPADDAEQTPAKPGEFEYVMQPDGTILKRPKKTSGNVIIAGTGFGKGKISRSSAIRAESSAVIEADEDDTVEIQ
ncbi:MAG TPA: hypothetical protein O0X42_00930 [Methanocorpusculum sp.]|nr:hypothetical protein [Methanocorpusculum sp.]